MKYLIKKTDYGILVKDHGVKGKVSKGSGWKVVDALPQGGLYRLAETVDDQGEPSIVREYFTADQISKVKDDLYAKAFTKLLANRSIHQQGVSYPALSKLALAELEKGPATAGELVSGVLKSLVKS